VIVGAVKRRRYKEWEQSQGGFAAILRGLRISLHRRNTGLSWHTTF